LAAGHPVRLLADCEPAPVPLHPYVSATAAGFAEDQNPVLAMRRALGRHRSVQREAASIDKQNQNSILKLCQMAVVYQAADQSRFIAS
jgi:hypothetical protein